MSWDVVKKAINSDPNMPLNQHLLFNSFLSNSEASLPYSNPELFTEMIKNPYVKKSPVFLGRLKDLPLHYGQILADMFGLNHEICDTQSTFDGFVNDLACMTELYSNKEAFKTFVMNEDHCIALFNGDGSANPSLINFWNLYLSDSEIAEFLARLDFFISYPRYHSQTRNDRTYSTTYFLNYASENFTFTNVFMKSIYNNTQLLVPAGVSSHYLGRFLGIYKYYTNNTLSNSILSATATTDRSCLQYQFTNNGNQTTAIKLSQANRMDITADFSDISSIRLRYGVYNGSTSVINPSLDMLVYFDGVLFGTYNHSGMSVQVSSSTQKTQNLDLSSVNGIKTMSVKIIHNLTTFNFSIEGLFGIDYITTTNDYSQINISQKQATGIIKSIQTASSTYGAVVTISPVNPNKTIILPTVYTGTGPSGGSLYANGTTVNVNNGTIQIIEFY